MLTQTFKALVAASFFLALLAVGALGTETRLLLFWPGCAVLGLAGLIAGMRWTWRIQHPPSDWCLLTGFLFAAYLVVRQMTSPVTIHAREDLFMLLGCAVAYTLSATVLSQPRARNMILTALLLILVGNLTVGFIHFSDKGMMHYHIVPEYMRDFGDGERIGGFFNNSNHLASFLTMMTLLAAGMATFGRSGAVRRLSIAFAGLSAAVGVALTVSRGAMVGLAIGMVVLAVLGIIMLYRTQRHLVGKVLAGVGVLAVLGGLVLYGVFAEQLRARLGGSGFAEGDPRPFIWRAALAQHAESPWAGVGSRMFTEGCITHRTADTPPWTKDALFVHNDWLQLLTEYGWAGLALGLLFVGSHFVHALRYLNWYAVERFPRNATLMSNKLGILLGAVAALVAVLVHALFEFHFHVPATAITAALLFGFLANPGFKPENRQPVRLPLVRSALKLTLIAAGTWMLYGTWQYGRADYYAEKAEMLRPEPQDALSLDDVVPQKLELLSRAIHLDPKNARLWYRRGMVRLEAASGQPPALVQSLLSRASTDLEEACRLNPYHMFTVRALADVYDPLGMPEEAYASIQKAVDLAPLYGEPRLALAFHFHRLQRWQEAELAYLWTNEARAGRRDEWRSYYDGMLRQAAGTTNPLAAQADE
jgi:O-antigen ligase